MHYVIVGNGVAGTTAAFTLRRHHGPDRAEITLIGDEAPYFFSRTALMYAYMNDLSRRDLEPFERPVYDRQEIERIEGRAVDLDAENRRLLLEDGRTLDYDRCLLATGASPRMIDFDGLEDVEDGVVNFVSLQDLDECERLTWSTDRAVVVGGGLIGVELAECFHHHGLDVTFLVREPFFWPAAFTEPEGELIGDHIRSHGIDLRHGVRLERIDTDESGRVSGVDTDGGEYIPCEMLGIAIGVVPAVDWLTEVATPPKLDGGILVDRSFETSLPDVYAAGDCAAVAMETGEPLHEPIWYAAKRHGRLAAESMTGDEVTYDPPVFFNSAKFFDIEYTTVGDVRDLPKQTRSLYRFSPDDEITQRIVFDDDRRVLGFSMLGSRWDHTVLQNWVAQGRSLDFVRSHLKKAQYDVEFGRVNLEKLNEEVRSL